MIIIIIIIIIINNNNTKKWQTHCHLPVPTYRYLPTGTYLPTSPHISPWPPRMSLHRSAGVLRVHRLPHDVEVVQVPSMPPSEHQQHPKRAATAPQASSNTTPSDEHQQHSTPSDEQQQHQPVPRAAAAAAARSDTPRPCVHACRACMNTNKHVRSRPSSRSTRSPTALLLLLACGRLDRIIVTRMD